MKVRESTESRKTDQTECWMFFFPGSSNPEIIPEIMICEQKPVEEYPSVEAAKVAFSNRINGRDPKYPSVDDDAFAWIYLKSSQRYNPQSSLWSMRALFDFTLKVGATVGNSRTFKIETRAETERRLGPAFIPHNLRKKLEEGK